MNRNALRKIADETLSVRTANRNARRPSMRFLHFLAFLGACFALCSIYAPPAQAAVSRPGPAGKIFSFGIYKVLQEGDRYEHKESTAGYGQMVSDVVLVRTTTEVPLEKGVTFGFEWGAEGLPPGPVKITMRVKHPQTTKPDGKATTGYDETFTVYPENGTIEKRGDYYILSEDWEMLPGEWTLSVIFEGKGLCEKKFRVGGK